MRFIGRLILLCLILLLSWPWAKSAWLTTVQWFGESPPRQRADMPAQTDQETVFWLDSERWIRFSLTESASTVRFLTHLQMSSGQAETEAGGLYGFAYRFLDADGREVYSDRHYFRAAIPARRRLEDGREFPTRFYDDPDRVASSAENLFFGLDDNLSAAAVELRVIEKPEGDSRIGIQVSEEQNRRRADAARLWPRMAPETQRRLLRPHVYPTHLVSPYEIENVLLSRWMPLGPEGVEGTDFSGEYLYTLDVPPSPPEGGTEVVPDGLYADATHWVTLPISSNGRYRLEIEPVNKVVGGMSVNLAHQNNDDLNVWQSVLEGASPTMVWTGVLEPGLMQLIPDVPVAVRLYDEETGTDLTPETNFLRADSVTPDSPVRFMLDEDNAGGHTVRMDVRTFSHPQRPESGADPIVSIAVIGREGEVILEQARSVNPPLSYYQRFSGHLAEARVSEASSLFLEVPPNAAELEVTSNTPLLITGYARLNRQPLVRHLPSQRRPWQGYLDRMPSWFLMRPVVANAQGHQVALQWFFKPIERDAAVAEGRYDWEALAPVRNSLIREVLFPHQLAGPLRKTAVGSVYRALPRSPVTLSLVAPEKNVSFRPELVYRRETSAVEAVTVRRNGKVWLERRIAGRTGRFSLPMIDAGQYTVEVKGSGQWFLNHTSPPSGAGYLERSMVALADHRQAFILDKREPRQVANLELVAPPDVKSFSVTVQVTQVQRKDGLLTDYSILNRRYNIDVNERETLVLGSQIGPMSSPVTVGVPLGEDLPPGRYQIAVESSHPGLLLSGYLLREGQSQGYRFFRRSLDGY